MNYIFILFFSIIQNYLKISILCSECDINTPLLTKDGCKLIYCSEEQFISGDCSKNNTIIKTQWLNNIISFNNYRMKYGNLAVNSNGDMIFECSNDEANGKRLFYGLKKNGNFYFKNENGEGIPSTIITIESNGDSYPIRFESSSTFVTINNTECLLCISIYTGNAELYDFKEREISYVSTFNFTGYNIESTSNTFLKIEKEDTIEYLFIFNGQIKEDDRFTDFYNVLQKYSFTKNKISFQNGRGDGYTIINNQTTDLVNNTRIVSSFITQSNIIVLFYLNNKTFVIELFNENLDNLNSAILDYFNGEDKYYYNGIFNKCIHIKKNIGAFLYYINDYDFTPFLKIIDINNYYSFELIFSYELNITNDFISDTLLNNFLKINNNKFASIVSSQDKNKLYIVLYEFYNYYQNIKIRTYKINLYELYNYKIYLELSSILYNDYLVLSSSVCNAPSCDNNNYFSFLIIFGYVNGSNIYINISHFLSEFNFDNNKNNIIDKILENITIDNNVFGYELQKKVKLVSIPEELIFSNIIKDEEIKVNSNEFLYYEHNITQNDIIKMSNKDYYFEFQSVVQEPSEETKINQYTIDIRSIDCLDNDTIEGEENIDNSIFYSRTIKVEFKLCYELCNTCKSLGISFNDQKCLSCLENYTYIEGNCYPKDINDDLTDYMTEISEKYINETGFTNNILDSSDYIPNTTIEYTSNINKIYNSDYLISTTTKSISNTNNTNLLDNSDYMTKTTINNIPNTTIEYTSNTNKMDHSTYISHTIIESTNYNKILYNSTYTTHTTVESTSNINILYNSDYIKDTIIESSNINNKDNSTNYSTNILSEIINNNISNSNYYITESPIENKSYEIIESENQKIYKDYEYLELCSYEDLLNQNCNLNNSIKYNNTIIYNIIKNLINYYTGNDNLIFKSEDNYVLQLTNSLNEENTRNGINENNYNLSMIELGECEDILKEINQINKNTPLIIYKIERIDSTASQKNIQYEVYNPDTKEKLDLSVCSNEKINIYIPLILSEETLELQQDLLSYGYDLFNPNDSFYQDICSGYTSSNGTDVLLSDRRIYYFNNTETACQEGCEYSEYNSETQQLKCECSVDEEDIEPEKEVEFDASIIFISFYDVLKYSNFLVLKCYKSIFSFKELLSNWGSIIVFIFFLFYSLFNLMYFINGYYYMKLYSAKMIFNNNKNNNNMIIKRKSKKNEKLMTAMPPRKKNHISIFDKNIIFDKYNKSSEKRVNKNIIKDSNELLFLSKNNYFSKKSKKKEEKNNNQKNLRNRFSTLKGKIPSNNSNIFIIKNKKSIKNRNNRNQINKSQINISNRKNSYNSSNSKLKYIKKTQMFNFKGNNFSDFELNELSYIEAVKYDKRSFWNYYLQLIKREHLIIFTFCSRNDYNIFAIKLSKFIFSIVLDLALNVVFFVDDSMHKIYLNYGKYNFIAQIPQILYSTIASESLDVLLRYLCITEKDIYRIKQFENKKDKFIIKNKIFTIIKYMKIKLIFYFLITFLFICFFWYFISAFCAVYKNTQIILIKDSITSFSMSLIYPFILYILPSGLRIISLKDQKKRLKFLYKISDIIPLI